MRKFNARHLMGMAIEVMRKSVSEARTDGKVPPKVGAVLVDIGDEVPQRDRITTAYRGEIREGDHAEYTLLERKNRENKLDNCILFATLEPCAPKSRNPPKLGCAERIVLARIKQVWVGIEDPDPTVDRKGIKYLQDNGVTVHMFDRDLQETIRAENKEFIAQARERAVAEEKKREVTLSPLEKAPAESKIEEFSDEALSSFGSLAKIGAQVGSAAFIRSLARMGLLESKGNHFVPTGFGLLLFGTSPRIAMPQAGLMGTIHYPGGRDEVKDFDGPLVFVPGAAIQWLKDKLPNLIDRTDVRRTELNNGLFELVREGVVNALVHRDYSIEGAKCHLIVTPDIMEIRSPGRPIEPITVDQLQSFASPMLSRNPVLHYVFAQMEMAEERGLGLKSMKQRAQESDLPLPRYEWREPYLVLTIYRTAASVTHTLKPQVLAALNADERRGWEFIAGKDSITSPELGKHLRVDEKKAQRILRKLMEVNLILREGKGPATRYVLVAGQR